jgi:ATP-dependent Clp protease, protease subunit
MNIGQEFQNYYVNHLGKGSLDLHNFSNQIQSSMTPYILEEREMRATQIDIFSRLMRDRIIWVAGPVDDRMSTIVQAQLMFMDNVEEKFSQIFENYDTSVIIRVSRNLRRRKGKFRRMD